MKERHFFENILQTFISPAGELLLMTEDGSFFSRFTKKQLYIVVVIGLLIFAAGAVYSYLSKDKLKSGGLTPEEEAAESNIYALSKILSMAGFIIALIPSVQILKNEIQKPNPEKSAAADLQKKDTESSEKQFK